MFRLLCGLLALLAACVSAQAQGVVLEDSAPSATLGRPFRYLVYLPRGYGEGDLRYPVLYLLHGAGGDEKAWSREGAAQATADRLIETGAIPPAIIVMPGCRACWWIDGAKDKAETAFWTDLVPTIARRYRVIEGRRGRLVAGLSAGGFGAVRFAMRYPDRIAAVAALSPAIYAVSPPASSSARSQPAFRKPDGAFDEAAWRATNYPSVMASYFAQPNRVAFYLMSGDNDSYGIAFETVTLFKHLYEHQPEISELRIVDGDHSWSIWSAALAKAMTFLFKYAERPHPTVIATAPPPGANRSRPVPVAAGGLQTGASASMPQPYFP